MGIRALVICFPFYARNCRLIVVVIIISIKEGDEERERNKKVRRPSCNILYMAT